MAQINEQEFAECLEKYLIDAKSFDHATVCNALNQKTPVEHFLNNEHSFVRNEGRGLYFGYNTELMMILLERAFILSNCQNSKLYSQKIAQSMQDFAQKFNNGREELCYPHFLLHGLEKNSLEEVVAKFENNSRIIHETLKSKKEIMKLYEKEKVIRELLRKEELYGFAMEDGHCDDYFGISYFITHPEGICSSVSSYVSKTSFFIDRTKKELYVITIQSKQFSQKTDPITRKPVKTKESRERAREYARLTASLGIDPRTYLLMRLRDLGKELGFKKIKVIKPEYHPYFIERHEGFLAKYTPVILQAGIMQDNGCYLENEL